MPIEPIRECGYRQINGMYLVTSPMFISCDRLPLRTPVCPYCGEYPRFTRSIAKINPLALFSFHQYSQPYECSCSMKGNECSICEPGDEAYLMWIGKDYSYKSFKREALQQGISKRIARIPRDFKLGQHEIWLAIKNYLTDPNDKRYKYDAVVMVFMPERIEYLMEKKDIYSKSEQDKIKKLTKQGVTIIFIDRTPENAVHFQRSKERKQKTNDKVIPLEVWNDIQEIGEQE